MNEISLTKTWSDFLSIKKQIYDDSLQAQINKISHEIPLPIGYQTTQLSFDVDKELEKQKYENNLIKLANKNVINQKNIKNQFENIKTRRIKVINSEFEKSQKMVEKYQKTVKIKSKMDEFPSFKSIKKHTKYDQTCFHKDFAVVRCEALKENYDPVKNAKNDQILTNQRINQQNNNKNIAKHHSNIRYRNAMNKIIETNVLKLIKRILKR